MRRGQQIATASLLVICGACSQLASEQQDSARSAPQPSELEAPRQVSSDYTAYFGLGSSKLDAEAKSVIDSVLTAAHRDEPVEISLKGHTDRTGSAGYNMTLSKERVDSVAAALISAGVSPGLIKKSIHGEDQPRVPTSDGQAESLNRRVDIELVKSISQLKEPVRIEEPDEISDTSDQVKRAKLTKRMVQDVRGLRF